MRKPFYIAMAIALQGCITAGSHEPGLSVADRPAATPVDVGIHWGWSLTGDAVVRPVQVFSMRGKTYFHMRNEKEVVFVVAGEVVPHHRSPPYLVIQGEPPEVEVLSDGYRVQVKKISAGAVKQKEVSRESRTERVDLND